MGRLLCAERGPPRALRGRARLIAHCEEGTILSPAFIM